MEKKGIIRSEKGMALLMVMGTITLLTALIFNFTFDTNVNKVRAYNSIDSSQVRLTAEAGLNFSLARLRLYQEVLTLFESNKELSKQVPTGLIDKIWSFNFSYPIPVSLGKNLIQKETLKKFEKETLLRGEMVVTIQSINNPLNLNLLRNPPPDNPDAGINDEDESPFEKLILSTIEKRLEEEREEDELYDDKYGDIEARTLVGEISYFVNAPDLASPNLSRDVENNFSEIQPKFAPITSLSELNLLPSWNNNHFSLLKELFSAHGTKELNLNKITEDTLKLIIPDITKEQSEEFFKYRDDPEDPHPFKSYFEFKRWVTSIAGVKTEDELEERVLELKKSGIELGIRGYLFKVLVSAKVNSSTLDIQAIVQIPTVQEKPKEKPLDESGKCPNGYKKDSKKNICIEQPPANPKGTWPKLHFLPPRIVEISPL